MERLSLARIGRSSLPLLEKTSKMPGSATNFSLPSISSSSLSSFTASLTVCNAPAVAGEPAHLSSRTSAHAAAHTPHFISMDVASNGWICPFPLFRCGFPPRCEYILLPAYTRRGRTGRLISSVIKPVSSIGFLFLSINNTPPAR